MHAVTSGGLPPIRRFLPLAPWWGRDLQTLRNVVAAPSVLPTSATRRLWIDARDGTDDRFTALVHTPRSARAGRPVVVLVHGLGGSETSPYMRNSARAFLRAGYTTVRANMRGAGPSEPFCRETYHAGRSADLARLVEGLSARLEPGGREFVVIGFSIGGNVVLRFLAEWAAQLPVVAGAAVSAPVDLRESVGCLMQRRNFLYHRAMLRRVRHHALRLPAGLDAAQAAAVREARTLYAFDEVFVAPRNGFTSALDYYARCSSGPVARDTNVPTLLIAAADDPVVPAAQYGALGDLRGSLLQLALFESGGHVGFHDRRSPIPFHDRLILDWLG